LSLVHLDIFDARRASPREPVGWKQAVRAFNAFRKEGTNKCPRDSGKSFI
jgi:hypothetical protein